nr:hypothetical protein Itr_chr02CG08760 [Ipomoea trifida]GMC62781.1 hypothetical protein Iba_chr02cCG7090 [Ipomoea batatas]
MSSASASSSVQNNLDYEHLMYYCRELKTPICTTRDSRRKCYVPKMEAKVRLCIYFLHCCKFWNNTLLVNVFEIFSRGL